MKLGILYKNGKIVNHRSLLKVVLNPVLRYFGYYIGSICIDNEIIGLKLGICEKSIKIICNLNSYNEYDFIEKKRMYF